MPFVLLVGSNEEIREGQGAVALTSTQAAARLGVSATRLRQFVEQTLIRPIEEPTYPGLLFLEDDVERLREARWSQTVRGQVPR